jgi:protein subunit release factor A
VQRAPDTETQGRIHTSAATVAVTDHRINLTLYNLPKVIGEARAG